MPAHRSNLTGEHILAYHWDSSRVLVRPHSVNRLVYSILRISTTALHGGSGTKKQPETSPRDNESRSTCDQSCDGLACSKWYVQEGFLSGNAILLYLALPHSFRPSFQILVSNMWFFFVNLYVILRGTLTEVGQYHDSVNTLRPEGAPFFA